MLALLLIYFFASVAFTSNTGGTSEVGHIMIDVKVRTGPWGKRWVVPMGGTSCHIWFRHRDPHGDNNAYVWPHGVEEDDSHGGSTSRRFFEFPSSWMSNSAWNTYIWTSCPDALIIDFFEVKYEDDDFNARQYGYNNDLAWCLSTDWVDGQRFNQMSQDAQDYDAVPMNGCARTFRLDSNGIVYYYKNQWHPEHWEGDRRSLQTAIAIKGKEDEIAACEAAVAEGKKQIEDCSPLVNDLLDTEADDEGNWVPADLSAEMQLPETAEAEGEGSWEPNEAQRSLVEAVRKLDDDKLVEALAMAVPAPLIRSSLQRFSNPGRRGR